MTGAQITIDVQDQLLSTSLSRAASRCADLTPLMMAIGGDIMQSVSRRFETGHGPGGVAWPPSLRALATGGQTLVDRGHLRDSITMAADASSVTVGTNKIYAAVHQFGATIEAKNAAFLLFRTPGGGYAQAKSVTIPARPFFGIDGTDAEVIGETADAWTAGLFGGSA